VRALLVTPLSGPLARYGRAGATALDLWARQAHWSQVQLEVLDAFPSAAQAMREGASRRPDVIFGPYGSGPAVAALSATERLVWNHGGATNRLCRPRFGHVVNLLVPAATYFSSVLEALSAADAQLRSVRLLHADTGFGREVGLGACDKAAALGLDMQQLAYAPGQAAGAATKLPAGDVLLAAGAFEDELAAARLLLDRPWRAAAFVGAGVEEVLAPLGGAREGLLGPCQWLPRVAASPTEGPDAEWFVRAYRAATDDDPPYPAAAAFAAGVVLALALREAGSLEDRALRSAADRLHVRTLFGEFRLDPLTGLQVGHQVLVVQWQDGVRRVVWPPERAEQSIVLTRV
jgi:branched-chain amino acid transport system substrate-binding protein